MMALVGPHLKRSMLRCARQTSDTPASLPNPSGSQEQSVNGIMGPPPETLPEVPAPRLAAMSDVGASEHFEVPSASQRGAFGCDTAGQYLTIDRIHDIRTHDHLTPIRLDELLPGYRLELAGPLARIQGVLQAALLLVL